MSKPTDLEKALKILSCFTIQDIDLSVVELSGKINISEEEAERLCRTLSDNNFLTENSMTERYRLGAKMLETAQIYIAGNNAYHSVWKILNSIMEISGETIALYVQEGDFRKCLMKIECDSPVRHTVTIGQMVPLDKGAAGRVLLAYLNGEECSTKKDGHAVTFGEREAFLGAIAVPIFDEDGKFFGALSISGPINRVREKANSELIDQLKSHASSLTQLVNHL